jgi:hypothetical protein
MQTAIVSDQGVKRDIDSEEIEYPDNPRDGFDGPVDDVEPVEAPQPAAQPQPAPAVVDDGYDESAELDRLYGGN